MGKRGKPNTDDSATPSPPADLTLVVRDHRLPGWYWVDNIIQDDYRQLIGTVGMDLYNLYARRAMNDTQKAIIPRKVILPHLGIAPSTLTEANLILEWCELVHIQRAHHRVHGIHLLNPHPITNHPQQLQKILENIYAATGGAKPKKPLYPSLRSTMLTRVAEWRGLQERIDELGGDQKTVIRIIRASELQMEMPGFEKTTERDLQQQVADILVEDGNTPEDAKRTAQELLETYGAEIVTRQLEQFPTRCEIAKSSERGLTSASGLFIQSVKKNWPEWSTKNGHLKPGELGELWENAVAIREDKNAQETGRLAELQAAGITTQHLETWKQICNDWHTQIPFFQQAELIRYDDNTLTIGLEQNHIEMLKKPGVEKIVTNITKTSGLALKFVSREDKILVK